MKAKSAILLFLCSMLIGMFALMFLFFRDVCNSGNNLSDARADSIAMLQQESDSLRFEIYCHEHNEQELRKKQSMVIVRTVHVTDSVKTLPPTGTLDYFNDHTGGGSTLNADSIVNAPLPNIIQANILFVQLDGELELNAVLSDRLENARTEIGKLARIGENDQKVIKLLSDEYKKALADGRKKDAALKLEKLTRKVFTGAFFVAEIITVIILI